MAKRPGWYKDPWGREGKRWWDGHRWTEHYTDNQEVPQGLAPDPGVSMRSPLLGGERLRSWWEAWWFIGLMLFFCCWPVGLILIWTRSSTPTSIKVGATVAALLTNFLLGLVFLKLGVYATPN